MKLEETLRALFDANVEFVLIGGAAIQMQGSVHLTEDLDFCYARLAKNLERLALPLAPTIRDSEVPRKICPFVSTPPQLNAN